jgi:hypothetical protein
MQRIPHQLHNITTNNLAAYENLYRCYDQEILSFPYIDTFDTMYRCKKFLTYKFQTMTGMNFVFQTLT